MTHTERLILENQIAIMRALRDFGQVTLAKSNKLIWQINYTEGHLNESEQDGER